LSATGGVAAQPVTLAITSATNHLSALAVLKQLADMSY
jgi:hypothetical protein